MNASFSLENQPDRGFVTVPTRTALEELAKKSQEAAQWFYKNLPGYWLDRVFSFGLEEVEIFKPE